MYKITKQTMFLILILMIASCLTACKETPEEPLVVGKNNDQMFKSASDNKDNKTVAQMLGAPEKMTVSVTDAKGNLTVNADASIMIPDTASIPITRIKGRDFTQDEADKIISYFIKDGEFNNRYKAGYDEDVQILFDAKAQLAKETDPDKRGILEATIQKFESAGISVPDAPTEVEPASKVFEDDKQGGKQIMGYAKNEDQYMFLSITNHLSENKNIVFFTNEKMGYSTSNALCVPLHSKNTLTKLGYDESIINNAVLSISEEEAKETAIEALSALDIQNMELFRTEEMWIGIGLEGGIANQDVHRAYVLEYVRNLNGTLVTYAENNIERDNYRDDNGKESMSPNWPYERIRFVIGDTGIIEFLWDSPYEIIETVEENTAIKPFSDIQSIFSRMMLVVYALPDSDAKVTYDINNAQLGLMRIMEKNNSNRALIVPVWDFFGSRTYDFDNGEDKIEDLTSYLTINAIDGSIIDRGLGY